MPSNCVVFPICVLSWESGFTVMDFYSARSELRRMGIGELLGTAAEQKLQKCIIVGKPCRFYFRYGPFGFCASEILGTGCEIERLDDQGEVIQGDEEMISERFLFQKPE